MTLRAVTPIGEPLSREDLQKRGDDLVGRARVAAVDAVRESMHSVFLVRGNVVSPADVRAWRHRARTAIAAWREVESLTTELLNELDTARDAKRAERKSPDSEGSK